MANLKIFKKGAEVLSISDFAKGYGNGITTQAVDYAIKKDKIDFTSIGKRKFVVLTEKTKSYVPNFHPSRKSVKSE